MYVTPIIRKETYRLRIRNTTWKKMQTKPNAFLIPLAMPLRPPKASCHSSSNMSNLSICCQCTGTFLANICSSGNPSPHSLTWRKPSRSAPTSMNTPRLQTQKWKTRNEKGSIAKVFNMRLLDQKNCQHTEYMYNHV